MTRHQAKEVKAQADAVLSAVIHDNVDRNMVVEAIIDDIISDIEETADWSDLDYNEVHGGDIEIALARVLINKLC